MRYDLNGCRGSVRGLCVVGRGARKIQRQFPSEGAASRQSAAQGFDEGAVARPIFDGRGGLARLRQERRRTLLLVQSDYLLESLVRVAGLEPALLSEQDFESSASTIPPHPHRRVAGGCSVGAHANQLPI